MFQLLDTDGDGHVTKEEVDNAEISVSIKNLLVHARLQCFQCEILSLSCLWYSLTLLHSEWPKLSGVLAILSAVG